MAGFSQPQHFFAAARLFWVFGSMRASIGSTQIFIALGYFFLRFGDTQIFNNKKCFGPFGGRTDPPNLENALKSTKL